MPIKSVDNNLYSHFYQFCNIVVNCNDKSNPSSSLWNTLTSFIFVIVAVIAIIAIYKKHSKEMDKSLHFYNSIYKKAKALSTNQSCELKMKINSWTDAQFFFANFIIESVKKSNEINASVEDITIDNLFYLRNRVSMPNILIDVFYNNIPSIILILISIVNPNEVKIFISTVTIVTIFAIKVRLSQELNKGVFGIILLTDNLLEKVCHTLLKNHTQEDRETESKKVCKEFFGDTFEDIYKKCVELENKEENKKNTSTFKK